MTQETTEGQIEHMVRRFLRWELPTDFSPDGGIAFRRAVKADGAPWPMPVGTNLLTHAQATAMVRHMLEAEPPGTGAQQVAAGYEAGVAHGKQA